MLKVINVDRLHTLPGEPSEHDFAVVLDTERVERHAITGAAQPAQVYSGTLAECWRWVRVQRGIAALDPRKGA